MRTIVPAGHIERKIHLIRGLKVMLDEDLATLYGVPTKYLNQQVRRNQRRFPDDFLLRLTWRETKVLRLQIATLEVGKGRHRKYPPLAFTEQGIAMLSGVLNSPRAVAVNIEIMRAFIRLRTLLAGHRDLSRRLEALERKYEGHDGKILEIFEAIRRVIGEKEREPKRKIGFI
jgi:hypothetical protein